MGAARLNRALFLLVARQVVDPTGLAARQSIHSEGLDELGQLLSRHPQLDHQPLVAFVSYYEMAME